MPENRFPVAFDVLVVIFSSSFLVMSVLVTREDFHEVPLRVEYGITKFGNDQAEAMRPLCESGAKSGSADCRYNHRQLGDLLLPYIPAYSVAAAPGDTRAGSSQHSTGRRLACFARLSRAALNCL